MDPGERGLRMGQVLDGKWQLVRKLGQGGMGTVYLAHDLALDRAVAVKFLSGSSAEEPEFVARFEREARVTAKLEHPHIVTVHAVGNHEGAPFLVMQCLTGMSLARWLEVTPRPVPLRTVSDLVEQVASALDFMHARGFIHRDLKPSNLFVSEALRVTVLDFGISRALGTMTTGSQLVGSDLYMAPEYLQGAPVDGRVDVYALGVIAYELLTGSRPYPAETPPQALYLTVHGPVPDPRDHRKELPPAVSEVVKKALAKEPGKRFSTAGELARALRAAATETPAGPDAGVAPSRDARRRRAWGLTAAAAVGLGLLSLLVLRSGAGSGEEGRLEPTTAGTLEANKASSTASVEPRPAPREPSGPSSSPERGLSPQVGEATGRTSRSAGARTKRRPSPAAVGTGELRIITVEGGQSTWASVYIDGQPEGATPTTVHLPRGSHQLKLVRPGFQTVERTVRIEPGRVIPLRVELQR